MLDSPYVVTPVDPGVASTTEAVNVGATMPLAPGIGTGDVLHLILFTACTHLCHLRQYTLHSHRLPQQELKVSSHSSWGNHADTNPVF